MRVLDHNHRRLYLGDYMANWALDRHFLVVAGVAVHCNLGNHLVMTGVVGDLPGNHHHHLDTAVPIGTDSVVRFDTRMSVGHLDIEGYHPVAVAEQGHPDMAGRFDSACSVGVVVVGDPQGVVVGIETLGVGVGVVDTGMMAVVMKAGTVGHRYPGTET